MTGNANSGRPRKAFAQRNGRMYVALDMVTSVTVNGHAFRHVTFTTGKIRETWYVDEQRFTDYESAAAEFVRRVNER